MRQYGSRFQIDALQAYDGLDGQDRATRLRFSPVPASLSGHCAVFDFSITPDETRLVFIEAACNAAPAAEPLRLAFKRALYESRCRLRRESTHVAAVVIFSEVFNEAMRRSVGDIYMLVTDKDTGGVIAWTRPLAPGAGPA